MVVRLQPAGPVDVCTYELAREYTILETLTALGQPKVPKPLAIDQDGTIAGRPLFVMSYVPGRVPSDDRPSFAEAGWLFEASFEEQRTFDIGLLGAIAEIHAVDWRPKLATLARAADQPLQAEVNWLRALHRCRERVASGMPRSSAVSSGSPTTCHSRHRLACCGAMRVRPMSWRRRSSRRRCWTGTRRIGPAELDIAWFLEMNRMRTVGAGVAPLPGFLPDDETVACYHRLSGRRLADLFWYRQYAALKMAVLMERHLRVAIARGALRPGHRLLKDNVALRRVEALLAEAKPEGRYHG